MACSAIGGDCERSPPPQAVVSTSHGKNSSLGSVIILEPALKTSSAAAPSPAPTYGVRPGPYRATE